MHETNPILLRLWRNDGLESMHRGAWALTDSTGSLIESVGDPTQRIFPRSATKSLQALPLIETGAADHFAFTSKNLALALSSHSGEAAHVETAADGLAKIGLDESALRCGPQRPMTAGLDVEPARISNNCSGKHTGFLAVSQMIGADPADYLLHEGAVQQLVIAAVADLTGVSAADLGVAIDGCSAPTFRMPISALATGLARLANPDSLGRERAAACRQITDAAAAHPALVAGTHERFCTDLISATNGRVFGKIGAEGVYALGVIGEDVGFACKVDDGAYRGFYALIIDVLKRHDLITDDEASALDFWGSPIRRNWDGLDVGRFELA